jgi:hypothetical protein
MASTVDGTRQATRKQFANALPLNAIVKQRLVALESKLATEKQRRVKAEQSAAGLRSACKKLQALLLRERADAALRGRVIDAEFSEIAPS